MHILDASSWLGLMSLHLLFAASHGTCMCTSQHWHLPLDGLNASFWLGPVSLHFFHGAHAAARNSLSLDKQKSRRTRGHG